MSKSLSFGYVRMMDALDGEAAITSEAVAIEIEFCVKTVGHHHGLGWTIRLVAPRAQAVSIAPTQGAVRS
jgi:hypothetical protein